MFDALGDVRISVLMPAYNAERYLLQSVQSVLAQTYEDFELIVVDDCSTDATPDILASIGDRRLRVLRNERNLGIVGALNRAMAHARGGYIARIDADDFCLPTRFAKQVRYLDEHPDIALVGTETFILEDGQIRLERPRGDLDPLVVRWRSLVSNPIGHPTMMFRTETAASLGTYLHEEFKYAEDFDFSHRLLKIGELAVLPEKLVIYRQHRHNITRTRRDDMVAKSAAVLARAYAELLGRESATEADLVARHLMAGEPVQAAATLQALGAALDQLVTAFLAAHDVRGERAAKVIAHAGGLWWAAVQTSLRAGVFRPAALGHGAFRWSRETRPTLRRIARSAVSGVLRRRLDRLQPAPPAAPATAAPGGSPDTEDPCRLYALIDVKAGPTPDATRAVAAAQDAAQAIYDAYGLRPIYALDSAAASQLQDLTPLRRVLDRHACAIAVEQDGAEAVLALRSFSAAPSVAAPDEDDAALPADLRDAVTITPETATAREQARLIRRRAARGHRVFVLRYRGDALLQGAPGPAAGGPRALAERIDALCRFVFDEFGGMPGNPADLVPQRRREHLWPRPPLGWNDDMPGPAASSGGG